MNRFDNSPVKCMSQVTMQSLDTLGSLAPLGSLEPLPPRLRLTIKSSPPQSPQTAQIQAMQNMQSAQTIYEPGEEKFYNGYGESHVVSHTERSILSDLKPHPFTDDIKNMADVIFNKMRYQVRRGKIRDQLLFYCVYCSHCELRRDVNPIQLGKHFGLTQGEVQKCDSMFSPLQTGYRKPEMMITPLDYLPDYCSAINLSQEAIEDILRMATSIITKDPALLQENPQTVASGLLRYYTVSNGIVVEDPERLTNVMANVTGRSDATINALYKRISIIDNS